MHLCSDDGDEQLGLVVQVVSRIGSEVEFDLVASRLKPNMVGLVVDPVFFFVMVAIFI